MDAEKVFALVLLAVGLYASLLVVWPYFSYLALAVLLAYTLFPLQRRLAPRVGPRTSAVLLMVASTLLFVLPLLLLLRVVVRQAVAAVESLRTADVGAELEAARRLVEDATGVDPLEYVDQALAEVAGVVQSGLGRVVGEASGLLGGLTKVTLGVTVFGFALYYLLVAGESSVAWVRAVTPLPPTVQDELVAELDRLTYAVLVTTLVIAVVQAVLTGLALLALGFSNVLFWTVLAVVFGVLPLVGSMFIWVPAALFLIATGRAVRGGTLLVYGFGVVNLTDNYLRPVVGGRSAKLNPAVLVVGMFGGLAVFGVMGIFVGPIVLGFTRTLVRVVAREYA